MKAKKIAKWVGGAAAVILSVLLPLIGGFTYVTEYRIADIDSSASPDGAYELLYQSVGEPDFPFGASHARLVLKHGGKTINRYRFDVANDGAMLFEDSWRVSWEADAVQVLISGDEQPDALYVLCFDGSICHEMPTGGAPEDSGSASEGDVNEAGADFSPPADAGAG